MIITKQQNDNLNRIKELTKLLNFHIQGVQKYKEEISNLTKELDLPEFKIIEK